MTRLPLEHGTVVELDFRASASSRTARRPSTSWTRCSLERRLSASTAFSGGHVPANTCLDRGGRS